MPSISVAMCTYNGAGYLPEQLTSIAAQTFLPDELIICDDRSTDRTADIATDFARTAPFPVRFHVNPVNLGSTRNFEQAMRLCTGDFIALTDQDDRWTPSRLLTQHNVLAEDPGIAAVFSNAELMDGNSNVLGQDSWSRFLFTPALRQSVRDGHAVEVLLQVAVVTGATMMIRRTVAERAFPIPSPWVHDAWLAWIAALTGRLVPIEESLIQYRLHSSQQLGLAQKTRKQRLRSEGLGPLLAEEKAQQLRYYRHEADQYRSLADFADAHQLGTPDLRTSLRSKVAFSEAALRVLGRPRVLRLLSALPLAQGYGLFTPRGRSTMLRDAIV